MKPSCWGSCAAAARLWVFKALPGISASRQPSACAAILRRLLESAAALALANVQRLAVGQLWVQGLVRSGEVRLHKVLGTTNPADALTKPLARPLLDSHLLSMHLRRETGRAATAPLATAALDTRLVA